MLGRIDQILRVLLVHCVAASRARGMHISERP